MANEESFSVRDLLKQLRVWKRNESSFCLDDNEQGKTAKPCG